MIEPSAGMSVRALSGRVAPVTGELQDQIALVDAARVAIVSGTSARALEILRRYQDKYPRGSFRPEATALKVEALAKLGRSVEARALAERFVAEHRGTVLASRVARLAGLGKKTRAEPAGPASSEAAREGSGTLPGFP